MTEKEKLDWLRLLRTEGIGQITFHKLIAKFGSATKAIEFLQTKPDVKILPQSFAENEFETAEKIGAKILFSSEISI